MKGWAGRAAQAGSHGKTWNSVLDVDFDHDPPAAEFASLLLVHVTLALLVPRTLWAMLSGGPRLAPPRLRNPHAGEPR